MEIDISTNIKDFLKDFNKIQKDIKSNVVEKGLDSILNEALEDLKNQLFQFINEEVRFDKKTESSSTMDEPSINIPKSDKEIIQHLFDVDLEDINPSTDFTKYTQSKVFFINNYGVRLLIPEGSDGSIEQAHQKALNYFNNAVFIDLSTGSPRYFLVNNFNPEPYVKIVCSRDVGITDKSRKRYENEKSSDADRFKKNDLGRFSTWTLKKEGVRKLIEGSVNITDMIEYIKKNQFDKALDVLKGNSRSERIKDLTQKLENLDKRNSLNPNSQSYINIVKIISSLKITKRIEKNSTIYTLVGELDQLSFDEMEDLLFNIKKQTSIWLMFKEPELVQHLIKLIEDIASNYLGRQ